MFFFSVRLRQAMHVDDPPSPKHILRPMSLLVAINQLNHTSNTRPSPSPAAGPCLRSSPDPVAALGDAWRRAREAFSISSVRGREATGTHLLRIGNYSTVDSACPRGKRVESEPFGDGGRRWKLLYYPTATGTRPAAAPPSCSMLTPFTLLRGAVRPVRGTGQTGRRAERRRSNERSPGRDSDVESARRVALGSAGQLGRSQMPWRQEKNSMSRLEK